MSLSVAEESGFYENISDPLREKSSVFTLTSIDAQAKSIFEAGMDVRARVYERAIAEAREINAGFQRILDYFKDRPDLKF